MSGSMTRRQALKGLIVLGAGSMALAACTPTAAPSTVQETAVSGEQGTTSPSQVSGPVTIRYTRSLDAGELEPMQGLITEFNEANPDIIVVMEPLPWDGFSQKIATMVAGGAAPDLTDMHPTWVTFFATQEVALPLEDLVSADPEFDADDFFPEVAAYFVFEGKRYGFPYTSWPTVTYFNKTMFDDLGVPYPTEFQDGYPDQTDDWTWEKLAEIGTALITGEGVERTFGLARGYVGVPTGLSGMNQTIFSYGGEVWNDDMTQTLICEEHALAGISMQVDLVTKYHVAPLPAESEGVPGGVNSGRYGMWVYNRSEVPGFKNVEFELGMAPAPRGPAGRVLRDGPTGIAIIRQSKAIEKAWEFSKFMQGPKPGELGGQRYQYEIQHAIPVRKSLFNDPVFLDNLLPWESKEIYQDSAMRVRAMKSPARFQEIDSAFREQMEAIILGETELETGMQMFCTAANEYLKPA